MLRGIQGFRLKKAAHAPVLPDLASPLEGSAVALGPGAPGAGGAGGHGHLPRRLPPRSASTRHAPERKSTESRQRGRGGEAASLMLPSLALAVVPGGASPEASLVAGSLCRGGAGAAAGRLCAAVACARACLLPVGRIPCAAPGEAGWEGRFPQPSLQLTAAPLRGFLGGGSSRAVHCPSSSIFPGSRRARFSAATLSLSSCHGQTPSKEDCSLQAVPKLGYNSNQT